MSILLHIAHVGGHSVHLFRPPASVGPDIPWIAIEDIAGVCGAPEHGRRLAAEIAANWGQFIAEVDYGLERMKIGPAFMLQEAVAALDSEDGGGRLEAVDAVLMLATDLMLLGLSAEQRQEQIRLINEAQQGRAMRNVH
jgi:hypothetical protein